MSRNLRTLGVLGAVFAIEATVLSTMVGIPAARADSTSYLQKLHEAGINPPRGDNELKEWGWEVCLLFLRGKSPVEAVEQAVYNSAAKPLYGMTEEQANTVVDIAASDLCTDRQ
ncbi:DUF732 domain-containing protein [Mycobacterium sp.]|uniref:DUF732 domain-containing protein n=1 Tax=Mycobacterium sp. TaxID=1785 RepID=UPI002B92FA46|nr:DUF732 domain-containing protein [Mycobacterium sp.]HKP39874.1 DUF732 domain-containing protein [Mycobacterium sp.]